MSHQGDSHQVHVVHHFHQLFNHSRAVPLFGHLHVPGFTITGKIRRKSLAFHGPLHAAHSTGFSFRNCDVWIRTNQSDFHLGPPKKRQSFNAPLPKSEATFIWYHTEHQWSTEKSHQTRMFCIIHPSDPGSTQTGSTGCNFCACTQFQNVYHPSRSRISAITLSSIITSFLKKS